ncbi:phage integrase SAM-like domain-containing protein [Limnohabitans sp. T6-5]|uniref:phage integrase SAM-like domain-containing protein n=1 Tax=Limnohabitans sp. T6-5 TaxID=1100724 RepID=UPI001E286188|nr:phage integrase SAM-like domain-containing protein [Limnohabitans sp. T6-5]
MSDFLGKPMDVIGSSGESAVAILDRNKPVFYVVSPEVWAQMTNSRNSRQIRTETSDLTDTVLTRGPMRLNRFDALAEQLLEKENQRVQRGELSPLSLGILRNRLDAHVLPFFKFIPPSQATPVMMDGFVKRLTDHQMSTTTISQYLVVVRKLFKLAIKHGFLNETPELPVVKVASRPRSMLSLQEYAAVVRTAYRLSRQGSKAPEIKASAGNRERFWVAPRNLTLAPDMAWVIRFMVNSFIRPGDLRQLKHKHVQVVRGESVYLRLSSPETKSHDTPIVTLYPAVHVYEAALAHSRSLGFGGPDDYVFLPAETDRGYALAVLGFWFKWVMREAGVTPEDSLGRLRTLYCLRHTSIMFRLLFGQGIDMLTLARNARTSVQMIEQFYASSLDGEMNVAMLQSRRTQKSGTS